MCGRPVTPIMLPRCYLEEMLTLGNPVVLTRWQGHSVADCLLLVSCDVVMLLA